MLVLRYDTDSPKWQYIKNQNKRSVVSLKEITKKELLVTLIRSVEEKNLAFRVYRFKGCLNDDNVACFPEKGEMALQTASYPTALYYKMHFKGDLCKVKVIACQGDIEFWEMDCSYEKPKKYIDAIFQNILTELDYSTITYVVSEWLKQTFNTVPEALMIHALKPEKSL
jgi:hypothetical protein